MKGTKKLYEETKNEQWRQTKMQLWKNNKKCQVYSRRGCYGLVLVWVWSAPQWLHIRGLVFSKAWLKVAGHGSTSVKGIWGPCPFSFPSPSFCGVNGFAISHICLHEIHPQFRHVIGTKLPRAYNSETEPFADWISCFHTGSLTENGDSRSWGTSQLSYPTRIALECFFRRLCSRYLRETWGLSLLGLSFWGSDREVTVSVTGECD